MHTFMNITKALADENRVRILAALQDEELCVCQLIELLELAPSTVSKHLSILRQARLVKSRKKGRWVYYRLPAEHVLPTVAEALGWVLRSITAEPRIREDAHRLAEILTIDPEVLCGHQSAG
jgi:DNA-binding transcriptional ArsR family regulator